MFKDIEPRSALKNIKKLDVSFKNEQDAIEYMTKWSQVKIPDQDAQWELLVNEDYDKNSSLLMWKAHHVLSDGIGLVMLLAYLNDELKPNTLIKSSFGVDFLKKYILQFIMFPICFMRMGSLTSVIKEDPNQKQMVLTPCVQSAVKQMEISKGYRVDDLKKACRRYEQMKINDLLTGTLSNAFAHYLPSVGDDKVKVMRGFLAVNIRDPDQFTGNPENVIFANINAPAPFQFTVEKDISKAMRFHKGKYLENVVFILIGIDQFIAFLDRNMIRMNVLTERAFTAFGDFVINKVYNALATFDFAVTNVAGPTTELVSFKHNFSLYPLIIDILW